MGYQVPDYEESMSNLEYVAPRRSELAPNATTGSAATSMPSRPMRRA